MKGAASAPPLIRQAFHSESSNLWSESGINLDQQSLIFDAQDVDLFSTQNPLADIEKAIKKLLDQNYLPISLGGDHSISYPILKAFAEKFDKLNILQFDAHPDLYDEYQGNRFSHACPFTRIMEAYLVQRLVQVGIRTMNDHQQQQVERFGVEVIQMQDWRDDIKLKFDNPLYISFDMDALDPAFAPGVSHYEPGGFTTRQVINIIHNIETPLIVGADIVEFNPLRDQNGMTAMVGAKILKELAGKMLTLI
ncbi:MAG: agmatinase [Candidatus Aminicenantes bacterium]|nr:agmatinase [Candidatus Aminicenantes bacterium]